MAENGPFGTPMVEAKNPPEKVYVGPFGVLAQEMRHIEFFLFLGAQNEVFSGALRIILGYF